MGNEKKKQDQRKWSIKIGHGKSWIEVMLEEGKDNGQRIKNMSEREKRCEKSYDFSERVSRIQQRLIMTWF
jgi:hypothetical protein